VNERRVLLGVASAGSPSAPFIEALAKLRLPASVAALERSVAVGNYIPAQRELIMNDAVDGGFDYLFFVDDDIVLPEDALERLIETAEGDPAAAVVGGLYYSRDSARPVAVAAWNSADTSTAHIPAFSATSTGIVDGVGFGCALLRIATAAQLQAPYFPAHVYIERAARRARQCDEDFLYCERVRRAGAVVRLDARVRCAHYDRASDSIAPVRWESDAETDRPRMIVAGPAGSKLIALDETAPRVVERHVRAEITYVNVD
jgi:hypothetical protein